MPTNVNPEELNYDHYQTEQYDRGIVNSIPGHEQLHETIEQIIQHCSGTSFRILELGVGTGLTAERILRIIPHAVYTAVDFSETMVQGAIERLKAYSQVAYVIGDYSQIDLPKNNDLVVSVIGIHHQENDEDKRRLFQRIYDSLSPNGAFIFGDLVTYRNPELAALNEARHYHHLVEHAEDEKSLREWAYHHKVLNKLAPVEHQIEWLREIGFKEVQLVFTKYNTALIYAKKLQSPATQARDASNENVAYKK